MIFFLIKNEAYFYQLLVKNLGDSIKIHLCVHSTLYSFVLTGCKIFNREQYISGDFLEVEITLTVVLVLLLKILLKKL